MGRSISRNFTLQPDALPKMKWLVYMFACISLAISLELPPELQEFINDVHNICIKKTGISEADHKAYDFDKNPHDSKLMCYMKCLMLEAKWMNANGDIQYDFIIETAHPEVKDLLTTALDKCRNIADDSDLCQKASNLNLCLHQADPVNWFLA